MHLKKLLYITCSSLIILTLIIHTYSYAIDEDSIYVWSSDSSSVSTSSTPEDNKDEVKNGENKENSRKFFRNYVWKCNLDGSKNR